MSLTKRFCAVVFALAILLGVGGYLLFQDYPPSQHAGPALFIGDSLTENWQVERLTPGAINAGSGGGRMDHISRVAYKEFERVKPGMVHIMIGSDETLLTDKVKTVRGVIKLAFAAKKAGATTIVIATLPPHDSTLSFRNTLFNTSRYNSMLHLVVRICGFRLADYSTAMSDSQGQPLPGVLRDGLHPSPAGYEIMNRVLADTLGMKPLQRP